ncbi:MAG: glycosyltransferase family 2 protein [Candidatus Woesearchaeota archaeon]
MAGKKVSIIIPSWNRKNDLKRSLDSIKTQDYDNIEVIVVDNGSKDGSVDMVEKDYKEVKLIKNDKNMGVSVAKNQGILASTGEFIHFCDSDIEMFNKSMVSTMVKILEDNHEIGALGERLTYFLTAK